MQILSRVTSKSNMFETVVSISIPGLETVDHFPILTAVAGILVQLLCNGPDSRSVSVHSKCFALNCNACVSIIKQRIS